MEDRDPYFESPFGKGEEEGGVQLFLDEVAYKVR
jgi:hypothetical protein